MRVFCGLTLCLIVTHPHSRSGHRVRKERDTWKQSLALLNVQLEMANADRAALRTEMHEHFGKLHRALEVREAELARDADFAHNERVRDPNTRRHSATMPPPPPPPLPPPPLHYFD
jgi:hypothetical protein